MLLNCEGWKGWKKDQCLTGPYRLGVLDELIRAGR
jgi:hypothetical protein